MRGIFLFFRLALALFGFNPAYAGNIAPRQRSSQHAQVQPRVCGEYVAGQRKIEDEIGSTPRMRGIFSVSYVTRKRSRFNPAYAGNIRLHRKSNTHAQVQPRVCGEYTKKIMK